MVTNKRAYQVREVTVILQVAKSMSRLHTFSAAYACCNY